MIAISFQRSARKQKSRVGWDAAFCEIASVGICLTISLFGDQRCNIVEDIYGLAASIELAGVDRSFDQDDISTSTTTESRMTSQSQCAAVWIACFWIRGINDLPGALLSVVIHDTS